MMLRRCCFSMVTLLLTMTLAASLPAAPVASSSADSTAAALAALAAGQKVQVKAQAAKPIVVKFENLCTDKEDKEAKGDRGARKDKNIIRLGDYIQLTIENVEGLKRDPNDSTAFLRPLLFINNIPMKGIYAEYISITPDTGKPTQAVMTFQLRRDSTNLKVWDVFYQSYENWDSREVSVTAGYDRNQMFATVAAGTNRPELVLVRKTWMLFVAVFILALIAAFVYFTKKSNLLRVDFGAPKKDNNKEGNNKKGNNMPYSLARSQLGSWTVVILSCYLLVWLATGSLPPITGSTLVMLGLSLATLTGGKFVDISRDAQQVQLISAKVSEGFFTDILSDEKGVSIHRFQMVAWTIILSGYFIIYTIKNLAFPQLDDSLLILMGISNVTYLGLKIPEKVSEQAAVPAPDPAPVSAPQPSAEQANVLQEGIEKFKQVVENANFDLRKQSVINLSYEVAAYLSIQQAEALKFFLVNDTAVDQAKALLQRIATGDAQEKEKAKTELTTLFSSY